MATATATEAPAAVGPVKLSFAGGRVCIPAGDAERYLRVVEAMHPTYPKDATRRPTWEFEACVLGKLREWCARHADKVWACYLAPPNEAFGLYVITKCGRYDFDLDGELDRLTMAFHLCGWGVHAMQLPGPRDADGVESYFRLNEAIEVYVHGQPTRGESCPQPGVPGVD